MPSEPVSVPAPKAVDRVLAECVLPKRSLTYRKVRIF